MRCAETQTNAGELKTNKTDERKGEQGMKTGYTSCDDCAYGQICKVPEEKRSACVMHTETEAQNFRKNTILGRNKQEIERMQCGKIR